MIMRTLKLWVLLAGMAVALCDWMLAVAANSAGEQTIDQSLGRAANLVLALEAKFDGQSTFGAGLILDQDGNDLLIVTANHAVRHGERMAESIMVKFRFASSQSQRAVLETQFDPDMDLAVLKVKLPNGAKLGPCDLPLANTRREMPSKRGQGAFPIGNPNGVAWQFPIAPDQVTEVNQNDIVFQSAVIESGHSGGGLFNAFGDLIGMVKADQPPYGVATRLTGILARLRQWGYLSADDGGSDASALGGDCRDMAPPAEADTAAAGASVATASRQRIRQWRESVLSRFDENSNETCELIEDHTHRGEQWVWLGRKIFQCPGANVDPTFGAVSEIEAAIRHGDVEKLGRLVRGKEDLAGKGIYYSPLHWAILANRPESVKFLLLNGAPINFSSQIDSPYRSQGMQPHLDTPLHLATALEQIEIMQLLIEHGADLEDGRYSSSSSGTPLTLAVSLGFDEPVRLLLKAGAQPVDEALRAAAANGDNDMIRLLKGHAYPDRPSGNDVRLLAQAVEAGQIDTLKMLIANGASLRCLAPGDPGVGYDPECRDPLSIAISRYSRPADYGRDGWEARHRAMKPKMLQVIRLLLKARVDPTPYLADVMDNRDLLELFLKAGADPNVEDRDGKTPLKRAQENADDETVRVLRAFGAKK